MTCKHGKDDSCFDCDAESHLETFTDECEYAYIRFSKKIKKLFYKDGMDLVNLGNYVLINKMECLFRSNPSVESCSDHVLNEIEKNLYYMLDMVIAEKRERVDSYERGLAILDGRAPSE